MTWNTAAFLVSCLAITVAVSPLYRFYTVPIAIASTSEDISTLACEDEAHLAAFSEQDDRGIFYGFALEIPETLTIMAEILLWTLVVQINRILAL